jgi:hypothetical protein
MSCLFDSLSPFFKKDSNLIRNIICDYLEQNNKIIDGLDTKFILSLENPNYINNMRYQYTWGGAIEIQTACNIWSVKINVHNIREQNNRIIEFLPTNGVYNNIINISWNGNHFEPIIFHI